MDFSRGPAIGAVIPHKAQCSSLSFHADGKHLFAVSEADSRLYLIDTQTGKSDKPALKCEREGIQLVSSTHHDHCVLIAGKGSPEQPAGQKNAVHYLSMYDNKILRKFRGHTDTVTDISMCPAEDTFLTASRDRTVRLWNAQQAGCIGQMALPTNTEGYPHVVYDSTGLVFAITAAMTGGAGHYIHLYDARNYSGGAFAELQVTTKALQEAMQIQQVTSPPPMVQWKSIKFNTSGNRLLVEADPGLAIVLDGFEGTVQRVFSNGAKESSPHATACFTPDDQSLLMGSDTGTIHCWNVDSGSMVRTLEGHQSPIGALAVNPKYAQVASSCKNTCLWIW